MPSGSRIGVTQRAKARFARPKSPSWTSLILSNKTRDALLGSTAKAAKNFGIGGGAALAVGLILGIVSSVMAPKEAAAESETVSAANR